jgi:hypothetical protein
MAQRVTVRERIDPAITASLFANYRSSADAVMELVDNSIDSRIKGSQLEVLLQVHPSYFVIETRGGEGMGPAELERNYLRWGGSPKRGRKLLGQYGQGGKAAIGHLGDSFTVEASRPGDAGAWRFADSRIPRPFQAQDLRAEVSDQTRPGGPRLRPHSYRRRRQAA